MNLHYRHTRNISNTREMERTVLALFESYQRLDTDILGESLTSGRMSHFLFEADETEVETKVKEARDAAIKKLDEFEQVGVTLKNSKAISEFVKQMRARLAKVTLDSGGFRSLKDFAGITVKQMSFVGDGISQAIKSVDSAVDATVASLKTLKIDYTSSTGTQGPAGDKDIVTGGAAQSVQPPIKMPLTDLIAQNENTSNVSVDKFKQGIQQKMAKSTGKGGAGFFSQIMNMLKGATVDPIIISSEQFAEDLLACTGEQIEAYLKGPGPGTAENPAAPAAVEIQALTTTADVTNQDIKASLPPGTPVEKKPIGSEAWRKLARSNIDKFKDQVNVRARELGASIDILENVRSKNNVIVESRWARLAGIEESK